jgi:hypothetical protein
MQSEKLLSNKASEGVKRRPSLKSRLDKSSAKFCRRQVQTGVLDLNDLEVLTLWDKDSSTNSSRKERSVVAKQN